MDKILKVPRYDVWAGDTDLTNPTKLTTDDQIAAIVREYVSLDSAKRTALRMQMSSADAGALLMFSERTAVFAVRECELRLIELSLNAIVMIGPGVADPRDILLAIWVNFRAAGEFIAVVKPIYEAAISVAHPEVATFIQSAIRNAPGGFAKGGSGYVSITTRNGFGLVQTHQRPFQPTRDLTQMALAVCELLQENNYFCRGMTIASEMPKIWLSKVDELALDAALKSVVACVTVSGSLRPTSAVDYPQHPLMAKQQLVCFIMETSDESTSAALMKLSTAKADTKPSFAILGMRSENVFILMIGRSAWKGIEAVETPESIKRFLPRLSEILREDLTKPAQ